MQENTCVGVFSVINLQAFSLQLYLKEILQRRYFPANFAKFLVIPFNKTPQVQILLKAQNLFNFKNFFQRFFHYCLQIYFSKFGVVLAIYNDLFFVCNQKEQPLAGFDNLKSIYNI